MNSVQYVPSHTVDNLTFDVSFWQTRLKKEMKVKYCPTIDMISDFMTKPLQGKLFEKHKKMIMENLENHTKKDWRNYFNPHFVIQ